MLSDVQILTVQVASSSEPTPELASFWSNKYRELYLQKLFFLDQATEELVAQELSIKEYREPRGYIHLPAHITDGRLDTEKLSRTVQIAVRYLDDLIDTLRFGERAQKIAQNYRAIKLSLQGLERYLDQVRPLSVHAEVQKVAEQLARSAYRASESLAEEKGTCISWQKYRKPPRIKLFDLLYNAETEEVREALEVGLQTNLEESLWEVYQRRNLTILDLPKNTSWAEWDDYAEVDLTSSFDKEEMSPARRIPSKPVEINVSGDKLASMSEALGSSPYKKLFSSLLKQQPASFSEKNVSVTIHLIFYAENGLGQTVKAVETNVQEGVLAYCLHPNKVKLLHAFTSEATLNLVYLTPVANAREPLPEEGWGALAEITFPEVDFMALLSSAQINSSSTKGKTEKLSPAQPLTAKPPALPSKIIKRDISASKPASLPVKKNEYRINTRYFGRVEFTHYSQNGITQKVRGSLRYRADLATAVFGILEDILKTMNRDYIPREEMLGHLNKRIYGEVNLERKKVLLLVRVLLELLQEI